MRRGGVIATVEDVEGHQKQAQLRTVARGDFAPERGYNTIIGRGGQSRPCRLYSVTDHKKYECRFTSLELATVTEAKFRTWYGARKEEPGGKDRRHEKRGKSSQQGDATPVGPVREQQDRPVQDVQAPRWDTNPNQYMVMAYGCRHQEMSPVFIPSRFMRMVDRKSKKKHSSQK